MAVAEVLHNDIVQFIFHVDPGLMELLNYVGKLYFPETCHDGTGKGRGNGG
jgi:hypothetical protein